jgi:hypothetical protein
VFKTEEGEFKGSKTLRITTQDDKHVISFGLSKAKAILASYEEIKKFVELNSKNTENNEESN